MQFASALEKFQTGLHKILRQGFCESCYLCNRSATRGFCRDCWRQVLACQQFEPLPSTATVPPLLAWGRYEGSLKRAIAQMKYQNHPAIATRLGEELGLRWLQKFPKSRNFQVIPIPLHRDRLRQRGYNQAELIARRFCQVVGVPCCNQGLVRQQATKAQHSLNPNHRALNLREAFTIGKRLRNKPILLIDDIFTTGATITEAMHMLEQSGSQVWGAAIVAQAILN